MGTNGYYDDDYYTDQEELYSAASRCKNFRGRGDVTAFNMIDYQSCENCRYMTADNRCAHRKSGDGYEKWTIYNNGDREQLR